MLNKLNKLNNLSNFNNLIYEQNLQLQQTKTTTTLITDQSQISILITWSPDSVANLSDSIIWRQKNSAPDCMTDAPETDASFLAPVSGACVMGISSFVSYSMVNKAVVLFRKKNYVLTTRFCLVVADQKKSSRDNVR